MQNVKPGKQLRIQGKQLQKTGETYEIGRKLGNWRNPCYLSFISLLKLIPWLMSYIICSIIYKNISLQSNPIPYKRILILN